MALLFSSSTSFVFDQAKFDNLENWSVYFLVQTNSGNYLMRKRQNPGARREIFVDGAIGEILVTQGASTDILAYTTNNITWDGTEGWRHVVVCVDYNGSAGNRVKIYTAPIHGSVTSHTFGSPQEPNGTRGDESSADLEVGENASAFADDWAACGLWDVTLSQAEAERIIALVEVGLNPAEYVQAAGCLTFSHLGQYNTTGWRDWSGTDTNPSSTTGTPTVSEHPPLSAIVERYPFTGVSAVAAVAAGFPSSLSLLGMGN